MKDHSHSTNQLMTVENQIIANKRFSIMPNRPGTELKDAHCIKRDGLYLNLKGQASSNQRDSNIITSKLKSNFDIQIKSKFDQKLKP